MGLSEVVRDWFIRPVLGAIERLEDKMADNSAVLLDVASKLRDRVFPGVQALVQENADLRARLAAATDEDVAESAATTEVVAATGEVSDLFAPDDLPDVPPVEEPAPTE